MSVGIFDSGLGGLTVWRGIRERLPDQPLLYYADTAHAPYGTRPMEEIHDLTVAAVTAMWRDVDLVVLACNTASAAALRRMQEAGVPQGKRVLGVFVPLIEALTERGWGDNSPPREVAVQQVALFATPATVASRAFQRELAFRAVGVDVEAQACAGLVDAIEDGDMVLAEAMVRAHVDALRRKMPHPQAAVLGCTHYPLVADAFQRELGADVRVLSQADIVAASLADYLERRPEFAGGGRDVMWTTGDPATVSARATQFLRRPLSFEAAP
ncbi:glutamate racemase [Jannaschia aquimarina]|uniref:Glutamate racemase n=1 Tax=Jannaschia aquimarina TaxID=935700 RepID=A0A0D1CR73_9RHOB|nr:glutamate racemase [Jannaschia aquimarina]KIT17272.1 Glutamate racemase [Jannaschia aquimarina]SNT19435.1 glutamate racemase [Jannaschia aquimarina]